MKNLTKCFLRLEGLLASKSWRELRSILNKLATGASTREPVAKVSRENDKNLENWNFSKSFSRLGAWLARELRELLSKLVIGLTRESESPKQSCTIFEIFENFQNKNTFQKQLKYSKIFLCLISIWLSKCNTFNQVQSHKWIRHSLNIDMCDVCGYQRWDSP